MQTEIQQAFRYVSETEPKHGDKNVGVSELQAFLPRHQVSALSQIVQLSQTALLDGKVSSAEFSQIRRKFEVLSLQVAQSQKLQERLKRNPVLINAPKEGPDVGFDL